MLNPFDTRSFHRIPLGSLLPALVFLATAASAQTPDLDPIAALPDSALGPLARTISLLIPEGPLESVLRDIAAQADLVLVFNTDLASAQPHRSFRVETLSARDALLRVLEGTPLAAFRMADGKILIGPETEAPNRGADSRNDSDRRLDVYQTIRGRVVDRDSRVALPGANVVIRGSDPLLGTTSDREGLFVLERVPLGRHDLQVSFIGFEPQLLTGLLVSSGKETVVEVALKEQILRGQEIVVRPELRKEKPLNDMALVSARSFSVEETRRYAGGADDPARMASVFAGVTTGAGVQDNGLIIRGNAPKGVLWRLEGVEIPNPNHFAGMAVAGGGGLTLFSSQLLSDSDFYTSAFPAEYGNALAGVFDMTFRSGNPTRREHAIQAGVLGIDLSSEGPFALGKPSTYLFNYRYSTIGLLLPLLPTEDVATYQDLSFKLAFPTRKGGRFEWWGIGGLDRQQMSENPDRSEWEYDLWDRVRFDLGLDVGATGLSHHAVLGTRTYVRSTAAATVNRTRLDQQRLADDLTLADDLRLHSTSGRLVLSTFVNHKFSPAHVNRTGIAVQRLFYDLDLRAAIDHLPPLLRLAGDQGQSALWQIFTQSRLQPAPGLTVNLGAHLQHFALNGKTSIEPRGGIRWALNDRHALSLGYGLHSQLEELRMYLLEIGGERPNLDLGFARSHQAVVGYDVQVSDPLRIKVEGYAQGLFDVPVVAGTSTSMLNFEQDWTFGDALVNRGAGRNYGVETTLERFFRDGYYFLGTASVFRSTYRGGDAVWRATRFDRGVSLNALFGKEFEIRDGRQVAGLNGRVAWMGGRRISPVDEAASVSREEVVYDESRAFEDREPALLLLDVTATYRINHRRVSQVWALQLKNALATKEVMYDYNYRTRSVKQVREGYPLPVLSYKVEF